MIQITWTYSIYKMDKRFYYYTVVLLVINGLLLCHGANDFSSNKELMVADEQNHPPDNEHANLNAHDTDTHLTEDTVNKALASSSPAPAPVKSTPSPTPPKPASTSMGMVTFTFPTMPPPATATMRPGGKDLSKIINLLFAILLVVTAILMAITGFCMMGLRRRYLIVSEQPKYQQLKPISV